MEKKSEFYTLRANCVNTETELTSAMEDYIEMITRLITPDRGVRVSELSSILNVKPSSVTKMIQHLKLMGYIYSEKYGYIYLTEKGKSTGEYLLYRHEVLHRFLCILNNSENELEQTEKIEHFLNRTTVENMASFIKKNTIKNDEL